MSKHKKVEIKDHWTLSYASGKHVIVDGQIVGTLIVERFGWGHTKRTASQRWSFNPSDRTGLFKPFDTAYLKDAVSKLNAVFEEQGK